MGLYIGMFTTKQTLGPLDRLLGGLFSDYFLEKAADPERKWGRLLFTGGSR